MAYGIRLGNSIRHAGVASPYVSQRGDETGPSPPPRWYPEGVVKRAFVLLTLLMCAGWAQRRAITYADLSEGQVINGFRAVAVYLDDAGRPMGARFKQVRSGFTLDLLGIQSVPRTPPPTWASSSTSTSLPGSTCQHIASVAQFLQNLPVKALPHSLSVNSR